MYNLIKLKKISHIARTIKYDIITRINHLSLDYTNYLFSLYEVMISYADLLPAMCIFIIWVVVCIIGVLIILSRASFIILLLGYSFFVGIRRGIIKGLGLLKPIRLFNFIFFICFIGMVSDLFISLPYSTQMSLIIIGLASLVEMYDSKKLFLTFFY